MSCTNMYYGSYLNTGKFRFVGYSRFKCRWRMLTLDDTRPWHASPHLLLSVIDKSLTPCDTTLLYSVYNVDTGWHSTSAHLAEKNKNNSNFKAKTLLFLKCLAAFIKAWVSNKKVFLLLLPKHITHKEHDFHTYKGNKYYRFFVRLASQARGACNWSEIPCVFGQQECVPLMSGPGSAQLYPNLDRGSVPPNWAPPNIFCAVGIL